MRMVRFALSGRFPFEQRFMRDELAVQGAKDGVSIRVRLVCEHDDHEQNLQCVSSNIAQNAPKMARPGNAARVGQ